MVFSNRTMEPGGAGGGTDVLDRELQELLEREQLDDGDHDKFAHYVKKDKIAESAVMGTMVEALCGEVFPVTKSPKPGSPVCPACKEVYNQLKK